MTTRILPVTELPAQIGQVLDELTITDEPIFITQHDRAQAVLMSVPGYDALLQQARKADQAVTDPLDRYRALLDRIDFSEHGAAGERQQHLEEVHETLAEARRRANAAMMGHE